MPRGTFQPYDPSKRPPPRISPGTWADFEPLIRELHARGATILGIQDILRNHGFNPTPNQLYDKIQSMGLRRYGPLGRIPPQPQPPQHQHPQRPQRRQYPQHPPSPRRPQQSERWDMPLRPSTSVPTSAIQHCQPTTSECRNGSRGGGGGSANVELLYTTTDASSETKRFYQIHHDLSHKQADPRSETVCTDYSARTFPTPPSAGSNFYTVSGMPRPDSNESKERSHGSRSRSEPRWRSDR